MTAGLFALGAFIGAVLGALVGYSVTLLPPIKKLSKGKRWVLGGIIVMLSIIAGMIGQWQLSAGKTGPMAEIRSPADGEKIDRIVRPAVKVNHPVPDGHSLWLGYQNEDGGPWIIQAVMCSISEDAADCGPLHVGHDERDRSSFRFFLIVADPVGTASLKRGSGQRSTLGSGANFSYEILPKGAVIISGSEVSKVTLR